MIYIEDVIISLSIFSPTTRVCSVHSFDLKIVDSLAEQTFRGIGYTEKQCDLALKIVNRYATKLVEHYKIQSITDITGTPSYRLAIRKSVSSKQISVVDVPHALGVPRSIRVQFPFDQSLVDEIRLNRKSIGNPVWDQDSTAWMFSLTEQSILFLAALRKISGFEADEEFIEYANCVDSIYQNPNVASSVVPMVAYEDGRYVYKNVHSSVPPLVTNQLIPTLFEARERGITVWDDAVVSHLEHSPTDPIIKQLLKSSETTFHVNSQECSIQRLSNIVQYLHPALFILPGGSELTTLKQVHTLLLESGVKPLEISVQFRLPKSTGADFNEYVREHQLNSPVSYTTKAVVISVNLPKPLIKSKIDFKAVVSFGRSSTHYLTRNLVKNHRNVIYYYQKGQMF